MEYHRACMTVQVWFPALSCNNGKGCFYFDKLCIVGDTEKKARDTLLAFGVPECSSWTPYQTRFSLCSEDKPIKMTPINWVQAKYYSLFVDR